MLSVIIPVYNEINTLEKLIQKVHFQRKNFIIQIIAIDDCSNDGSTQILKNFLKTGIINNLIISKKNEGKGASISKAIHLIKGDIVLIQDADLEYSPRDYSKLVNPIIKRDARVVYGSRIPSKKSRYASSRFTSLFRVFANHILTIFSNLLFDQKLTDAHTCYKVFKKEIFINLKLKEKGFGFCPEVTAMISKKNIKIIEVPINYNGRKFSEGKKISYKDGFEALWILIKKRFNEK
jgi:glycosyltransferase involved in cell wall biosynthesis